MRWDRHDLFLLVALSLLCSFAAHASDPLTRLREKAAGDPRVLAARAAWQAKESEAGGAVSVYLPVVRGTGGVGRVQSQDPLQRDGKKRVYGLELEQPIPLFGREAAVVEEARAAARVEAAEVRRVEQEVLAELIEAALTLEAARQRLALREELVAVLREGNRAAQEAVAGGGLRMTEARLLGADLAKAQAQRVQAEAERKAAEVRIASWFGNEAPPAVTEDALRALWSGPLTLAALEEAALASAPAYGKARAEAERAGAELAVARANLWPRLSLTLSAQRGKFGTANADNESVLLGLNMPLYEGGRTVSQIESAAHRQRAALEQVAQEERATRQRVGEAWARWEAAEASVQAWQEAERQQEETVRLVREQLAGGVGTEMGLARARQALIETRLEGVEQRLAHALAWVRLMQAAGALAASAPRATEE